MRAISEPGNLWDLAVLSLVREEPMHPYQMLRLLRQRHKDDVLVLKRGSLYHAINRLESAGLIAALKVDREGRRPERTIYQLTGKGEQELLGWLRERIANVRKSPSEFMGTLSFLVHLPPNVAATCLEARVQALQGQIAGLEAGLAQAGTFVDRINLIESEYLLAMLKAEIHWVRALLLELREGRFHWDLKQILKAVRAAPAGGLPEGAGGMNGTTQTGHLPASGGSRWRRVGPVLTLLVLSPVIGEVMSGATRLSYIFALLPEIMVWGCGALLIRELVRRWGAGWTSALFLGFGLAVAEEFIIQQTSIAPLPWLGGAPEYGRVWGVNWPYFIFMLGYEAVWIVLVPIQVTELIFPRRRSESWLRLRGRVVGGAVFVIGSFMAWFLWTRLARPNAFHVPVFHPPLATVMSGLAAILLLVVVAYLVRRAEPASRAKTPPPPWRVVVTAFLLGLPWYGLMVLVFGPARDLPLLVPMVVAALWAAGVFLLIRRWAPRSGWRDMHRWALCFGALLVCVTGGFLGASTFSRLDLLGKIILNVLGVACMLLLAARIARRSAV